LDYLKGAEAVPPDFINFHYGRKAFDTAFVPGWLHAHGYAVHNYSMLSRNCNLDRFYPFAPDEPLHWLRRQTIERIWIDPFMKNKLLRILGMAQEPPAKVVSSLRELDRYNQTIVDSLNIWSKQRNTPQFVYVHFDIPHEPYIYLKEGSPRPYGQMRGENDKQQYLDQIQYVNGLIRELVPSLLAYDGNNRIIVIQGDHGYRKYLPGEAGDRLGIFNAIYFPDKDYESIPDTALAVNTFRIIFNQYFGQRLPLLK